MKRYLRINWQCLQPQPVIGVDEAGRGCLAGPVFSAAVILKEDRYYPDSKTISPKKREELAKIIISSAIYGIGQANVEEIEQLNILQASFLSMRRAIAKLPVQTAHILVDGSLSIPKLSVAFHQTPVVKGDKRVNPIAAAGILAKVHRDEWILKQDKKYPQYGFSSHKGYSTAQHRQAIASYGLCPHHRKHFAGVREYLTK